MSADSRETPKPFSGKRIIITRAHTQSEGFAHQLEALGAEVISIPTIEIRPPQSFQPLDKALKKIPAYDWLVLTSVNGVEALRRRLEKAEMDAGMLRQLSVAAIGPATREEAEKLGLKVTVMPEQYIAESVVELLRPLVKGKRILLVRAKIARDVIPQELRRAGAEVDVAEAYETVAATKSQGKLRSTLLGPDSKPDVITFTSSSTARNFAALLDQGVSPRAALQGVIVASIGPVTSATLKEIGINVDVEANDFTIPGLIVALLTHFLNQQTQLI